MTSSLDELASAGLSVKKGNKVSALEIMWLWESNYWSQMSQISFKEQTEKREDPEHTGPLLQVALLNCLFTR
jgi:hypothetical protein